MKQRLVLASVITVLFGSLVPVHTQLRAPTQRTAMGHWCRPMCDDTGTDTIGHRPLG